VAIGYVFDLNLTLWYHLLWFSRGAFGRLWAVGPGPREPRGRWLDSWAASKMWPARTLKHPLHRPWGYLRIERFHRATLVTGSREPKAVKPRTSGCDHGDGASSRAQAKKGAGGFRHLPPRPPLYFYPLLSPPRSKSPFPLFELTSPARKEGK
jgi:hypothetical protein